MSVAASVMSGMDQAMMVLTPGHSQAHTPSFHGHGMARTPGAPMTPVRTPGPPHTPGTAHTPAAVVTPGSVTPGGGGSYHGASVSGCHSIGMVHTPVSIHPQSCPPSSVHAERTRMNRGPPRHLVFLTHIPLSVDDQSCHEANQRMVVLYGVGRQRDEARHSVKKVCSRVFCLSCLACKII